MLSQDEKITLIMSQSEVHKGRFDLQAPSSKQATAWTELIRTSASNLAAASHVMRMGPLKKRQRTRLQNVHVS
jgi:hypothetical protein